MEWEQGSLWLLPKQVFIEILNQIPPLQNCRAYCAAKVQRDIQQMTSSTYVKTQESQMTSSITNIFAK